MNLDKVRGIIGFANRSRNLAIGEANCLKSIKSGKAKMLLISTDIGPSTKKRLMDKCNFRSIPVYEYFDRYQLGEILGTGYAVCICITGEKFYEGLKEELGGIAIAKNKSI